MNALAKIFDNFDIWNEAFIIEAKEQQTGHGIDGDSSS